MPKTLFGFTETRCRALPELQGQLHEMTHEKSGAGLVWLERDDDNMTFSISFRTTPQDSTGVFHILEHSVLCGSEKYPVKEPFVELLKSSLNTFLNAMTFPDKTMYPVSSRNGQDLINLMRVYMDAVLRPRILTMPEIFRQEGWHHEYDENGKLQYKGVVFNEMKGVFADSDQLLYKTLNEQLFPDTCYALESGGDPAVIPDLTYEKFVETYKTFYHPSNAYIVLDGRVDLPKLLKILDEEYLSGYDRIPQVPAPELQKPVCGGSREVVYEQSKEEPLTGRTRLGHGYVIGTWQDRETLVAAQVLAAVLADNNQSPLSRAILSRNLAEEVSVSVENGILQSFLLVDVRNLKAEDADTVDCVLRRTLETLAAEGLDREQVLAAMANLEFRMRERDYGRTPRGLAYAISVMDTWLYDGDPAANLEVGDLFRNLEKKAENGYFEQLIRTLLLDNPHTCRVVMQPSHTVGDEARRKEADRLAKEEASWDDAKKAAVREEQARLEAWQSGADTPEALATIPMLTLEDISAEPEALPQETLTLSGLPVLAHRVNTGGILYLNLYFDLEGFGESRLPEVSFLCQLLGRLAAGPYSAQALQTKTQRLCGSLDFSIAEFAKSNTPLACRRMLQVSVSLLESNLDEVLELVRIVLTETKFDDSAAILELLRQEKTAASQRIINRGHTAAINRVCAGCSVSGVVREVTGGLTYYQWVKALEQDAHRDAKTAAYGDLCRAVFAKEVLTVGVTGTMDGAAEKVAAALADALPESCAAGRNGEALRPWGVRREGIVIPSDISFAVTVGQAPDSAAYTGKMQLAGQILSLEYLWNRIRVQGGAYGTGFHQWNTGLLGCYSYRDPSAERSLRLYKEAPEFLESFCDGNPDLTGYIIGAIGEISPLMTPRMLGEAAETCTFCERTHAERRAFRQEILSATPAELRALAEVIRASFADAGVCVVGSQKQLDSCELESLYSL